MGNPNPIVMVVLNSLFEVTGYDPATVLPDDRLQSDLSMSREQIDQFMGKVAMALRLTSDFALARVGDLSLRELSERIKMASQNGASTMLPDRG